MAGDWDPTRETLVDYLDRSDGQNNIGKAASAAAAAPAASPAPAAAGANPSLAGDPAYLAFQRALGLERTTAEQGTQSQIDAANQSLATRLPGIAQQGEYQRQSISGGMENRGLLQSGETEDRMGRERAAEGAQVAGLQDQTAQRVAALQQALAEKEANFGTQDVNQQLASADRQQQAQQQAAIQAALQQALAGQGGGGAGLGAITGGLGDQGFPLTPVMPTSFHPGDVRATITSVAQSLGVDPRLALAVAQKESGFNPTAVGDNGTSFGEYQLHRGGELGSLTQQQAFDPATNARTALSVMAQVARAHPDWSPGQIAAAAQRPADPAGYAAAINSIYQRMGAV